jgi:uncharacterized protein YecE (DUF72 family)
MLGAMGQGGMRTLAGTSGYSYKAWKGSFYPPELRPDAMLGHYAARLPAVEINNTFYRLPKASVLESWARQVPAEFRFAIKASRRITHIRRLKDAGDETAFLLGNLERLGERLGAVLFQLPPNLRCDVERLQRFCELLPDGLPAAFEFRHESWLADDVLACLRERGFAWCIADTDEEPVAELVSTATWGYVRLRRSAYAEGELEAWARRVRESGWETAFAFFKHEDAGLGPRLAARLLELVGEAPARPGVRAVRPTDRAARGTDRAARGKDRGAREAG